MAYTLVPTELIVDGAVTSAKLDTNISISGTLGVTGELTLLTHMNMGDNDKIKIGTGGDLEIYHDGSNSYISNSTGNIYLADTNGSVHIQAKLNEESIVCTADGSVSLYYDNAVKLSTTASGVAIGSTNNGVGGTIDLSVGSTSSTGGITLWSPTSGTHSLGFGDGYTGTDRYRGYVEYAHNGDSMRFATGATERVRITSDGNLGLGNNNNPVGTASAYNTAALHIHQSQSGSYGSQVHLTNAATGSTAGNGAHISMWSDDDLYITNQESDGMIKFASGGNADALVINDSGDIGIGTTSPAFENGNGLEIRNSSGNGAHLKLTDNASGTGATQGFDLYMFNSQGYIENYENAPTVFRNNGSEVMRIRETGAIEITGSSTTSQAQAFITNDNSVLTIGSSVSGSVVKDIAFNSPSTMMYIDGSSGSVGIGTSSPSQALEVTGITLSDGYRTAEDNTNYNLLTRNSSNTAVYIQQAGSGNILDVQSGSAGAGQGTSRLLVNSSGNVGIGTSSPSTKLHLGGTAPLDSIIRQDSTTSGTNWEIGEREAGKWQIFEDDGDSIVATFMSSGNVGIGTTSPYHTFDVFGAVIANGQAKSNGLFFDTTSATTGTGGGIALGGYSNGTGGAIYHFGNIQGIKENSTAGNYASAMLFSTRANGATPTEKMRIDSGGALHIGTTAQPGGGWDAHLNVAHDTNAAYFRSTGSGGSAGVGIQVGTYTSTTYALVFYNGQQGAAGGVSLANGNASTSVTYNTSSDYRMKENIRPLENGLDRLKQLKPVKFDWKTNDETSEGFIAHEVQEIFPDAIAGEKDGEEMQGMDYGRITPLLVKAIQEQQTIIDDLKSRIETLEG